MFFLTAIVFILIFSLLILIHELGHFTAAKRAGVKVEEFGFGLPPRIWGKKKGETIYSINWIPFGGFVRMLGEDGSEKAARSNKRSFSNQSLRTQAWIVSAGVVMNFALAFILLTAGFIFGIEPLLVDENDFLDSIRKGDIVLEIGEGTDEDRFYATRLVYKEKEGSVFAGFFEDGDVLDAIDGQTLLTGDDLERVLSEAYSKRKEIFEVEYYSQAGEYKWAKNFAFPIQYPVVNFIEPDSPAETAGLEVFDEILAVEGESILLGEHVMESTQKVDDGDVDYLIRRDDETISLTIPLRDDGRVGIGLSDPVPYYGELSLYETPVEHKLVEVKKLRYGVEAPVVALKEMWRLGKLTAVMFVGVLGDFITGGEVPENVAGPIGIAQMTSISLQAGFAAVVRLVALLSLSLGVINILPIPALDGGRLLFIVYRGITGHGPNPKVESLIHGAGFLLLIAFILYITFNDVLRLI